MPVITPIGDRQEEMAAWRRRLNSRPELALEEHETSAFVAEKLHSWDIDVHRGLAGTGVAGPIRGRGTSGRAIALRADKDAALLQNSVGDGFILRIRSLRRGA